jgi:hypothetical protein
MHKVIYLVGDVVINLDLAVGCSSLFTPRKNLSISDCYSGIK